MKKSIFLILCTFWVGSAHAESIYGGKELSACSNVQDIDQCMKTALGTSEKQLSDLLSKFYKAVEFNHDDSYGLDGAGPKKSTVYLKYFKKSQSLWVSSRDNYCDAMISASGSYALHSTPSLEQCIINMNKRRMDEINLAGEF